MAFARFKSNADRAEFVANLVARGYKLAPPPNGELRALKIGEYRVYNYHRKRACDELRVSYWLPVQGPRLEIPKPSEQTAMCTTPGHEDKPTHARGLCSACLQRFHYWTNAERRKKKRLLCRKANAGRRAEGLAGKGRA